MTFWLNAGAVLGVLVAFVALISACCAAALKALRAGRRVSRFLDEFLGDGKTPGLVERVETLDASVGRVSAEVFPNGGGSLRDALDDVRRELRDYVRAASGRAAETATKGAPHE